MLQCGGHVDTVRFLLTEQHKHPKFISCNRLEGILKVANYYNQVECAHAIKMIQIAEEQVYRKVMTITSFWNA